MANRFWVGGTGTWNTTNTANWSASNGGAGGASVPTSADNVYFTNLSGTGTCTVSGTANPGAVYFSNHGYGNYTGTFAGTSTVNVNGDFAISSTMTWTHTGVIAIVGTGTRIIYPNGKTISSTLSRNMTSGTLTMNGAFTTTNLVRGISGTGGTWDLGTYTLTAGRFDFSQYGGANTLVFGTGAKLVASSSGNVTVLSTGATFLFLVTGTPNVEILSPPAGVTNTISVASRTDLANAFRVTLIASGTGTIDMGSNATNNGPRSVTVNAGGAYTIKSCFATESITFNAGFTGTAGTGLAAGAALCGWPVDSTGCTITMNGIRWNGYLGYFGSTANANPINFGSDIIATEFVLNNFTWKMNGYNLYLRPNTTSVSAAALYVDPQRPTVLDFGSGTGGIEIDPDINGTHLIYFNGASIANFSNILNRRDIRVVPKFFGATIQIDSTTVIPTAKRFDFRILYGAVTLGNYNLTWTNSTGTSVGVYINNYTIDDTPVYSNGTITLCGNLTGPTTYVNTPRIFNTLYFDSGSTQTITTRAMKWDVTLRMNAANTVLSLADNYETFDLGASGAVSLYMGSGLLQLNSYTFKCASINWGFFSDVAGSGISFGTGKIRFYRQGAGNSCMEGSPPANIVSGTWSGSRMIELEVPGSGEYIILQDVLNQLEMNVTIVSGPSSGGAVQIGGCTDLIVNASPGDTANSFVTYVARNLTLNANLITASNMYLQGGGYRGSGVNGTWISNGFSITCYSSAKIYGNKVSNSITLGSAALVNGIFELISGTIALSSYQLTTSTQFLIGTGTDAKAINFGTGSIYLSSSSGTALSLGSGYISSTTLSGTSRQIYVTTPSSASTKTLDINVSITEALSLDVEMIVVGTGGTVSFGAGGTSAVRNLVIPGGTYTLATNGDFYIYGDLTVNGNITAYTGTTNRYISRTSGTQLINTNGFTFGRSAETLQLSNSGSIKQLTGNSVFAGPINLLGGTLDVNGYRLTGLSFASANSTVRTIAFGTAGAIRLTGTGTVWNTSTNTNLTVTGTNRFVEPNLNAAQTLSFGTPAEANTFDVSVPSTASNFTLTFTANNNVRNLTFANVAYTVSNIALNVYGGLNILGTNPTFTSGSNGWTFSATSGSYSITTNGELIERPITINAPGGTYSLGSALTMTYNLTLTAGSFNASNFNATILNFVSNNSNVRSLTMGNGNWTLGAGTDVWNITTSTNMTLTRGTGEIIMPPSGGGNFRGGGLTYPKIRFRAGGTYLFTGTNSRFADLIRDSAVVTSFTINFGSGETFFFDDFTISGISPSVQINIGSSSTTQHNLSKSSGVVSVNFLSILRSNATGGAAWYAGTGSTNAGTNSGWIFTAPPQASGNMLMIFT